MTSQPQPPEPFEVFISYSHDDEALRDELARHLSALRLNREIIEWHDRRILSGEDWENEIDARLNSAKIVLLLVSSSFLASDYCTGKEMRRAFERHDAGEAKVIPIILRAVAWKDTVLGRLLALPKDGKAVTAWPDRDQAFADVANGISAVVRALRANP